MPPRLGDADVAGFCSLFTIPVAALIAVLIPNNPAGCAGGVTVAVPWDRGAWPHAGIAGRLARVLGITGVITLEEGTGTSLPGGFNAPLLGFTSMLFSGVNGVFGIPLTGVGVMTINCFPSYPSLSLQIRLSFRCALIIRCANDSVFMRKTRYPSLN